MKHVTSSFFDTPKAGLLVATCNRLMAELTLFRQLSHLWKTSSALVCSHQEIRTHEMAQKQDSDCLRAWFHLKWSLREPAFFFPSNFSLLPFLSMILQKESIPDYPRAWFYPLRPWGAPATLFPDSRLRNSTPMLLWETFTFAWVLYIMIRVPYQAGFGYRDDFPVCTVRFFSYPLLRECTHARSRTHSYNLLLLRTRVHTCIHTHRHC